MTRILLMQSRIRKEMVESEQQEYIRATAGVADLSFESTLNTALNWKNPAEILQGFDGVIFGGSGELDFHGGREERDPARVTSREILARTKDFVSYMMNNNVPLLGICYGHQLIGELHRGSVSNDSEQKKVGSYEVVITEEGQSDPLFSQLPKTFIAQYGHKDSITSLPDGSVLLATGNACKYSALRYGTHTYTTQFHPELTAKDVAWKLANSPGYLPEGVSAESLVKESPEASSIIKHWVSLTGTQK